MKLCTVCGVVTSRAGSRCLAHARQSKRSRHNALYSTRAWQRLSVRGRRAWRGEHGNWCPGYGRAAHPARDLTVDHIVPLAAGGAPFDIGNTAVLCRSCARRPMGYPTPVRRRALRRVALVRLGDPDLAATLWAISMRILSGLGIPAGGPGSEGAKHRNLLEQSLEPSRLAEVIAAAEEIEEDEAIRLVTDASRRPLVVASEGPREVP